MSIKKLTKKVWFEKELWDVVRVYSPTRFDTYILVQRTRTDQIHEDGKNPVDMRLIDSGNDEFFPDTQKVRNLLQQRKKSDEGIYAIDEMLSDIWLDVVMVEKRKWYRDMAAKMKKSNKKK